ncbi:hypothetical protein G9C98_001850 [Cotesia typhae]|uniref:Protein rogdi n=1 Tax=Cotesia typhae TaxID=2053667 RepID=A0A8J5UT77_9HYME|nr:hypothetical protein G9C98_001850 [Cotesia typhae]
MSDNEKEEARNLQMEFEWVLHDEIHPCLQQLRSILTEVTFKVQRQQNVSMRTSIQNDHPWKLQQIQDAANHLQQAIAHIDNVDRNYLFKTSEEVLHILANILGCLQRSRSSLIVPKKKTIDDLMKSRNMISVFSQYKDFTVGSRVPSVMGLN